MYMYFLYIQTEADLLYLFDVVHIGLLNINRGKYIFIPALFIVSLHVTLFYTYMAAKHKNTIAFYSLFIFYGEEFKQNDIIILTRL